MVTQSDRHPHPGPSPWTSVTGTPLTPSGSLRGPHKRLTLWASLTASRGGSVFLDCKVSRSLVFIPRPQLHKAFAVHISLSPLWFHFLHQLCSFRQLKVFVSPGNLSFKSTRKTKANPIEIFDNVICK